MLADVLAPHEDAALVKLKTLTARLGSDCTSDRGFGALAANVRQSEVLRNAKNH
jgi:hypothetical protein